METETKVADHGHGQAAIQNILAGQQNTTASGALSVSFILPIDGRYRLSADEYAWRIEKRKGKRWIAIQWHSDIEALVNSLAQRMIQTSEVQTLARALAAVENVYTRFCTTSPRGAAVMSNVLSWPEGLASSSDQPTCIPPGIYELEYMRHYTGIIHGGPKVALWFRLSPWANTSIHNSLATITLTRSVKIGRSKLAGTVTLCVNMSES
jgi:hypothetical protein